MNLLRGTATGLSQEAQTAGGLTTSGPFLSTFTMYSSNQFDFRVENKPVHLRLDKNVNVLDGETVAVAGTMRRGVFRSYAMKNTSTGVVYAMSYFKILLALILAVPLGYVGVSAASWVIGFTGSMPITVFVSGIAVGFLTLALVFLNFVITRWRANWLVYGLK